MAAHLTIKLVSSGSETLAVTVPDLATATVRALKQLIEARDARRFPVAAQRLIFQGQILQDDKTLSAYSVADGCALHLTLTPGAARSAPAAPAPAVSSAVSVETQLRALLQHMRADAGYATAVQTMHKICENVIAHPHEDKYRKLRLANAALKSRLLDRAHGLECVKLLGFVDGVEEGHLVLVPTAEKWEHLVASKRVLDEAIAGTASPSPSLGPSGIIGAPATPNWAAQAQSMLQNPMLAQALQHDPMVQQMAQLNPMLAQALQNPALLSQQLQMLQQNPAMMQHVTQMMQDPSAMARMQQMLTGAGAGAFGASPFGASPFGAAGASPASNPFAAPSAPAAAPASNPFAAAPSYQASPPVAPVAPPASTAPASAAAPSTSSDDASFDENEIADAIARSLQDHA